MTGTDACSKEDPYDLSRFVRAQEHTYERALAEIRDGRKRTHWMWYIFPQIDGLGVSSISKKYAIKSADEARAYLDHPVLGPRLLECAEAVVRIEGRTAEEIFGSPDDLKLRSCATLFACILPQASVFDRLIEKFYRGERDGKTQQLLGIVRQDGKGTDGPLEA
ncbi:MAG: calpastatin [Betaproteobacteria bacterium RIFCSPLOWO2_02_FULL_63_19]|nr:MAG: calpastatin [Betaproteobacteria bacterium RIFCSPLOWO2_02_FULL_63_19]